jgi:ribonucleotide reductase alpha subunit
MREVAKGGEARTLFQEIIRTRVETGEPYLMFVDNVNKVNPPGYTANNLEVKTSNICLLGEELVLTSEGPKPIKLLVGKVVEIWDGEQWVINRKFEYKGHVTQLAVITYQDGHQIKTTLNHKFPLTNGNFVEAKDLKAGMEVEVHALTATIKPEGVVADVEITEVESTATYCTEVPTTHKFALADGRMTGNCSEITAYTDENHTFVCCLSSMNLAKWDEWKDTKAVYYATWFLDGVMQEYIDRAKDLPYFDNAIRFATKSRMLGLGAMGYHTLLQKNMLPFGSFGADLLNRAIFSYMADESNRASRDMANAYGEPEWCKNTGARHTHTLSVAPTVSNSTICGNISPGIEPWAANNFEKKSAVGTLFMHNKQLEALLEERGMNTEEVWDSITAHTGSVQHLDCLTDEEKEVFLTAREINQMDIVKSAATRQKCMDRHRQGQAQSVNLFFTSDADETYVTKVHFKAWELGLKTLYYCRSQSVSSAELPPSTKKAMQQVVSNEPEECLACHG